MTPRNQPCVTKPTTAGDPEKIGLLSQAAGNHGAKQTSSPRYMRTMTRRKRSDWCSQLGMRGGAAAGPGSGGGTAEAAGGGGMGMEVWVPKAGGETGREGLDSAAAPACEEGEYGAGGRFGCCSDILYRWLVQVPHTQRRT